MQRGSPTVAAQIREDEEGVQGVFLQKRELNDAAGQCIRATLRKLAPLIMPLSELVRPPRDTGAPDHAPVPELMRPSALRVAPLIMPLSERAPSY